MRALCTGLFLVAGLTAFSQSEAYYNQLRKKYASENAVYVSRKEDAVIKIENNAPVIYSTTYQELLLLNDNTSDFMDREIYWADFSSIKDLDARSVIPDGDKSKTIKVKDFTRTNEISEGEFYDDERAYKFTYPGLTKGSREVLSYTERISDPHLFGRFFFNVFTPTEDAEYSVTVPKGVKIRYKLFNVKDSSIAFTIKQDGKNTIYTWKVHEAKKLKEDDYAPRMSYYAPHVVVLLDSYTVNGVEEKVMSDTTAIYDWFYSMVKDVNTSISPEMQKLVDSITAGASSDYEKVKRIFYWVQDNITYIAYEDSLGGFVPRAASLVCSRRFGDCKDMASTLTQMIKAAGLEAHQTWIGTRDIPYTFEDVPSPMATNHMICTYIDAKGKPNFLDATGKYAPFTFFTSMIQGKEAMVGMGPGKYEILHVPVMDSSENGFIDSTELTIDNIQIHGQGHSIAEGYEKILICEQLLNYENKEKKDFLNDLLEKGNNTFRLDTSWFENINDKDKDLGIQYKFDIGNYVQRDSNNVYVNMSLEKPFWNDLLEPDRQAPREFEFKRNYKNVTQLNVPDGYTVTSVPPASSYIDPMFGFKVNYYVDGNTIVCKSYVYINTLMFYAADFERWNKMVRQLSKAYNETVTLTKQ